ncbi:MAG: type II toxin-antitoxin system VapC family toxin [Gammaproteobacteria bacterium]|nr:type II toxin-antitoxin system VapC family toxin [Gammaproteobacteria bacterium]
MRAIDTNVLIRLLLRDDPRQARLTDEFIAGGAWVSHLVVAETVWVLAAVYRLTHEVLADTIEALLDHESLVTQDAEIVRAAERRYRARNGVDFSDCLILEVASHAGHKPLGTFDRHLGRHDCVHRL